MYDLASKTMTKMENNFSYKKIPVQMVNLKNEGAILYPDDYHYWRYQSIAIRGSKPWTTSQSFLIAEGPTLNELSWDLDKERVLVLAVGEDSESVLSDQNHAFHVVEWRWAQGYLNAVGFYHIFTDQAVYVFEQPEAMMSMTGNDSSDLDDKDQIMAQRMLRLNYNDYFVCKKKSKAYIWDRLFTAMLNIKLPKSNTKGTVNFP